MPFSARLTLLALAALLTACAGKPPVEQTYSPFPIVNASADDVLISAIGLVGTPYRYGGNTPDSGFDCSGLIGYVYRNSAGISLPRSTREMIRVRAPSIGRADLQSGDLVFFATNGGGQVSHAGIYVGEGRFVHAPSSGGTVRLDYLDQAYWQKSFLSAKRVLSGDSLARQP
ncbi:C40 family peptidase [Pseudomonas sp. BMS12]|uniref:C40 family peptidase n=1 Tax=Pseudomonas sp. BMS12 TaxID=1796033 RepID=UPI00083A2F94|nr:C40 family peptidase [Pseudomonas sp. BMS12]